jgi:hypothetical protein
VADGVVTAVAPIGRAIDNCEAPEAPAEQVDARAAHHSTLSQYRMMRLTAQSRKHMKPHPSAKNSQSWPVT